MKLYAHHGLVDFVLCLGYKGHVIKDFFLNYEALTRDFTVSLGAQPSVTFHGNHSEDGWRVTLVDTGNSAQTGARVHRAAPYLADDTTFCLTYGDGVGDVDVGALLAFHRSHGRLGTITGVRPPGRFGELVVEDGLARSFDEKPQVSGGLINGGFFVFERAFVGRYLTDRDDLVLEHEPLRRLAEDRQLMVWRHDGFWQPMDTYREWKLLEDLWSSGDAPWKVWS